MMSLNKFQLALLTEISCPVLATPAYGSKSSADVIAGSIVIFSCKFGYELSGSSFLQCEYSGNWNGTAPRCTGNSSS